MDKRSKLFIFFAAAAAAVFTVFAAGSFAAPAQAATVSLTASRTSALLGQPVRFDVTLDTQGDDANAIQGEIDFPASQFTLRNIVDGESPVSFWIQPPAENVSGSVSFSGIIPGGFEGAASSVVSIWLLPSAPGTAKISLDGVQLLRNDGQGTEIPVTGSSSVIVLVSSNAVSSTPIRPLSLTTPDAFTPVVSRDPSIYNGQYFVAFSTTDKGSGIDHYEVMEVPAGLSISAPSAWHVASSPYLLEDQSLSSNIYVRAVDHDGNFIVVELPAQHPEGVQYSASENDAVTILLCLLLLVLLFAVRSVFGGMGRMGRKKT